MKWMHLVNFVYELLCDQQVKDQQYTIQEILQY